MARRGDAKLIQGLAAGETVKRAAELAGLSERTAFRRLKEPEFARKVREARRQLITVTTGRLARASAEAVSVLQELQRDAESESVRMRAARAILAQSANWEAGDLELRIEELERRVEEL